MHEMCEMSEESGVVHCVASMMQACDVTAAFVCDSARVNYNM